MINMSKAVLISIKPKWCKLIASGRKTVEVRKSRPKLETPFKVYIYSTYGKVNNCESLLYCSKSFGISTTKKSYDYIIAARSHTILSGKVIGEFVVDYIDSILAHGIYDKKSGTSRPYAIMNNSTLDESCLTAEEIQKYLGDTCGYGWHISDLVIYDTPKDLSKFGKTRPPQSWCYVEDGDTNAMP